MNVSGLTGRLEFLKRPCTPDYHKKLDGLSNRYYQILSPLISNLILDNEKMRSKKVFSFIRRFTSLMAVYDREFNEFLMLLSVSVRMYEQIETNT